VLGHLVTLQRLQDVEGLIAAWLGGLGQDRDDRGEEDRPEPEYHPQRLHRAEKDHGKIGLGLYRVKDREDRGH